MLLKQRLEPNMLESLGLIPDEKSYSKKLLRANTQQMYAQRKYNLMREETEGYSKLVVELSNVGSGANVLEAIDNIRSLIGHFHLDPNRCFDFVLESFEHNLGRKVRELSQCTASTFSPSQSKRHAYF